MQLQKIAITLGCCCLIAGFPSVAGAQTVTGSFADLAGKLKPGKTVYVTDGAGRKVKGKMTDLSVSSLQVLIDGNEETFVEGGVRQIAERRRYTGDFAATGFAAGALLGVVFGAVVGPPCSCTGNRTPTCRSANPYRRRARRCSPRPTAAGPRGSGRGRSRAPARRCPAWRRRC